MLKEQIKQLQQQVEFYKAEKLKKENEFIILQMKYNQEIRKDTIGNEPKTKNKDKEDIDSSQPPLSKQIEEENRQLHQMLTGTLSSFFQFQIHNKKFLID
jgi:hypothetical protein